MKRTLTLLTILLLVVFMVGCEDSINPIEPTMTQSDGDLRTSLAKGPVEKATGNVMFYNSKTEWDEDGQFWNGIFNAHESQKGSMTLYVIGADEFTPGVFTPDGVILRTFEWDVKYVNIDGINDVAFFAGICTTDINDKGYSQVGKWFVVRVVDNGTPGSEGDIMGWQWMANESAAANWVATMKLVSHNYSVDIGNLQVHYYGE